MSEPPTTPSDAPPAYSDAPPEEERGSSGYLLLAVNFVVLAGVLWWVIHKARSTDGGQPIAEAGVTNTDPTNVSGPGSDTDGGGAIRPNGSGFNSTRPISGPDDPFGSRSGGPDTGTVAGRPPADGRRVLAARPPFDAQTQAQFMSLEEGISALGPNMEVFRTIKGAYPTSKRGDFGANRGNEALVEILSARGAFDRGGVPLGDTDGDGRKEMLDPWGRALVYFSHDDYDTTQEVTGVGTLAARERWTEDTKTWQGELRFQLFSVGPNGKDDFGGYDDCNSWVTR